MPVDPKHCRTVFRTLSRELTRIRKHSTPQTIHKLRTSTRRVEVVVQELVPEPDRSARRLLKILRNLRKQTGKVRDLDVQIASLRNLKISREARQKSQLLRTLTADRVKREKKLAAVLDKSTIRALRKRLKIASSKLEIPEGVEPLSLALAVLAEVGRDRAPLNQSTVHQYRIAAKRARYLIEIAGDDPRAGVVIDGLKKMQDVVGDWHDWSTLAERAENLFGGVKESALVAALRNLTRAKFRESVDAVVRTKAVFSEKKIPARAVGVGRKPDVEASKTPSAAA